MSETSFSYYAANFKRKLINTLVSNDDITTIISPELKTGFDIDEILRGGTYEKTINGAKQKTTLQGYILDYYYAASETTIENKLFICVETNVNSIEENIIGDMIADVWVFTPKTNVTLSDYSTPSMSDMNTLGYIGNKIDCCIEIIEKLLRGSTKYGLGMVRPVSRGYMTTSPPTSNYYGKKLSFTVKGYSPKEVDNCGN